MFQIKNHSFYTLLLLVGLCLMIAACTGGISTPQPVSPLQSESPLANPADELSAPYTLEVPEPDGATGVVHGRFVTKSLAARVYLAGDIYLAPAVYSEGEVRERFASLTVGNDPKADLRTEDGEFVFLNVKPGTYGIVIYTPLSSFIAPTAAGDDVLFIDVKAGEVLTVDDIIIY